MTVTLAIRFPLGHYHAAAWDRSANEGAVEWPPAPWRLLRALVGVWYSRLPDLPASEFDRLLDRLGDPPRLWTSVAKPGHTRHYLPDSEHRSGETGQTDLTLDSFLSLPAVGDHVLVQWDARLDAAERDTLHTLARLIPYVGRSESVCDVRLLDNDPTPDETWWRPEAGGDEQVRLLAPTVPVQRAALELSTVEVRKSRRTLPAQSRWVHYGRTSQGVEPDTTRAVAAVRDATAVTAIRFAVLTRAPLKATDGLLAADKLHMAVTSRLDGGRAELLGHAGASTDHRHAHWIPLPVDTAHRNARGAAIGHVMVWVPIGLAADEIGEILSIRRLTGSVGNGGYEIKGLPEVTLRLEAVGTIAQVAPELCGPARAWRSLTPYLPVRHRKRESFNDYLAADVRRELEYRGLPTTVEVRPTEPDGSFPDRWANQFRRYRIKERLRDSRPGLGVRLVFPADVTGPLMLGQLSHFGCGIFVPEPEP